MILDASCKLVYRLDRPVPAIFMLRPRSGSGQWLMRQEFHLHPEVPVVESADSYGNLCQRLVMPAGEFHVLVQYRARVPDTIDQAPWAPLTPVAELPAEVLHFLLPSRYCESDRLGDLAARVVASALPGYPQAEAIRAWIHHEIRYVHDSSNSSTSATDTAASRTGVCRDFAHLGIALCRAINIPARMVVGFLHQLEPMDLHAWFEAFVGGRWYTFDATQPEPRGNRIILAHGRDASDVALATLFGGFELLEMEVCVVPADFGKPAA